MLLIKYQLNYLLIRSVTYSEVWLQTRYGLDTEFIDTTTGNYSIIADVHTLQISGMQCLQQPFPGDEFIQWRFFSFMFGEYLAIELSQFPSASLSLSLSLILRPTVSRPIYLGIKHPSGACDQIFICLWQLRPCSCGRPLVVSSL
jgi:hypothetical protein